MTIQQEWDQAVANDVEYFNSLSTQEKAKKVRRFVQAEAAKYGGGKSPQVKQFLQSKLNEYQPVSGIKKKIDTSGLPPGGPNIIFKDPGSALEGYGEALQSGLVSRVGNILTGKAGQEPIPGFGESVAALARQGLGDIPYAKPDWDYGRAAALGLATEPFIETAAGLKAAAKIAKVASKLGIGGLGQKALQTIVGATAGAALPAAAGGTGLMLAKTPEQKQQIIDETLVPGVVGWSLGGLGGLAEPIVAPAAKAIFSKRKPPEPAAPDLQGSEQTQTAPVRRVDPNAVVLQPPPPPTAPQRQVRVGQPLPKERVKPAPVNVQPGERVILGSRFTPAPAPTQQFPPLRTPLVAEAPQMGPLTAPEPFISPIAQGRSGITQNVVPPVSKTPIVQGPAQAVPSVRSGEQVDTEDPIDISRRLRHAAVEAALRARQTIPEAQVAPTPPTQGRVRPEATEELFGPLTQEQAAARQLIQEEADAVEAALRARQTIPTEQPPASTGMMSQRAPGRTVDISGRGRTRFVDMPGGRRAAIPMRARTAETEAPGRTVDISGRGRTRFVDMPGGRRAAIPMRARTAETEAPVEQPVSRPVVTPGPEVVVPVRAPAPKPATAKTKPAAKPPKSAVEIPAPGRMQQVKGELDNARIDLAAAIQRNGGDSPEAIAASAKVDSLNASYNKMLDDASVAAGEAAFGAPSKPAPKAAAPKAKAAPQAPKKAPVKPAAEAPVAPKTKAAPAAKEVQAAKQAAEEAELELEATGQRLGKDNPETIAAGERAAQLNEKYNSLRSAAAAAKKAAPAPATKPAPKAAPAAEAPPAPKGKMSKGAKAAEVTPPPAPAKPVAPKKKEAAKAELTRSSEAAVLPKYGRGLQEAAKNAESAAAKGEPTSGKSAGETMVIGGAKASEAKAKGARRGSIDLSGKEPGKKLIHKDGGEATDSVLIRFIKEEDGFFNAEGLAQSFANAMRFGFTGAREIIAVVGRLIEKIRGDGFRAAFKKSAATVTRTKAYTAVARTLPRIGDIVESTGQAVVIKPMNFAGDLMINIAASGKGPNSRAFLRSVGEVMTRDRSLNVEGLQRILRTPAKTSSKKLNTILDSLRRFTIGEFGLSKSMIDQLQAIEDLVLIELRDLQNYASGLLVKYAKDEEALIQIGRDIEDVNYKGSDPDVLEGKRVIGQISKSLLDVGAITQGAYDAYVKDGMSSYLPRIYRKWLTTNENRAGLSVNFFREVNRDPGLMGYEHRGITEVMTRKKLNEELAKGVKWRELGRTKQSTEDIARAQKAFEKAETALRKAEQAVKDADKARNKANRLAPLPDGSDAAAIKTRKTMASQKFSVEQERLRVAKRNFSKAEAKLSSYDLKEKVTVVRDWTEEEQNKWNREWNPIPSMVKLYDTALRDMKNGRMFQYLVDGSDEMGRYSKSADELGVPTDVKSKIPKEVVDDDGKRWVYLDPDKLAVGGTVARYGKLGGRYVRDDIASYLLFHNQFGNFRRIVSETKKYSLMNLWKQMKTTWSTTYYVNNFFNASPNVELAGGSVTDLGAAFKDVVEDAPIIQMLTDANIIQQGKLAKELAANAQSIIKKGLDEDGVVTHLTASNAFQKAGEGLAKTRESLNLISQATDDLWRVTLYKGLRERQKMSHEEAIKIVRDAIYDSKRVTSPLADAAEVFIPFARSSAWMLDQLVTNSIRNPHKLAYLMAVGKFMPWAATTLAVAAGGTSKEQIAAEEESIEDWLKDATWPIGWPTKIRLFSDSTGKAYYWDTKNFGGLHSIAAEVGNSGLSYMPAALSPGGPWWTIMQVLTNKDMFRGQDIVARDALKREITIDKSFISSPMSEFLVQGLAPSGVTAAYRLGRSMLGIPDPSGKMISPVTRLLAMAGIKIREVDPEIQIPQSEQKGRSAIGQWQKERNKDERILKKMEEENAPKSALIKQQERIDRWDAKIEELRDEEAARVFKLYEGMPR